MMKKNTMNYKGYVGSVDFSADDNCLFGKVLGIRSLVSYEAESVAGLRREFESAVDDYLAFCAEKNIAPEKPYRGSFNVRIAPDVHRRLAEAASRQGVSMNKFVERIVAGALGAAADA